MKRGKQMRLKTLTIITVCLAAAACDNAKDAAPRSALPSESAQAKIYMQIRNLTAEGSLQSAANLTDDPAAYMLQMETAKARMDEASFANGMIRAAQPKNIEAVREAGNFSLLVTKYEAQGTLERAPTFYRKSPEGIREIVEPDETIPCKLVRDFYAIKGEKNPKIENCTEDKVAGDKATE
jgi:hypothetical protein